MALLSPGVQVQEIDLTTIIPAVSSTVGAFVGQFRWGPALIPYSISNEIQLANVFDDPDANTYLSFFTAANFLAYGSSLQLVRAVNANTLNATCGAGVQIPNETIYHAEWINGGSSVGPFAARYPGDLGNSLEVSICPSFQAFSSNLPTANSTSANSKYVFSSNAAASGLVPGDLVTVGSNPAALVTAIDANGITVTVNTTATSSGALANASRTWAFSKYFAGPPNTSTYADGVNGANDEVHIIVVDADGLFTGTANTVLETYPYVSVASDATNDDGTTNYYRDVLYTKSNYAYWLSHIAAGTNWGNTASNTTFTTVISPSYLNLINGFTATVQDGDLETGWNQFINKDTITVDLLLSGNVDSAVAQYIIEDIAEARSDCVAFVSPQQSDVVNNVGFETNAVVATRNNLGLTTSYAVMDSNWKYQYDKYNNVYRWVPLNGDIAGLCARTDQTNAPWWSPAGFNRGQILNTIKLAWNPAQSDRDTLYSNGVNPVLTFPGQGPILYGDKTLQTKPSAFDRINVRRLFIVLERAISTAAKYSLFEFNDQYTQAAFVAMVSPYLSMVQGQRGITAYQVVCDSTNNTPEVIDSNQFIGDIYIQPARSINYITLHFVAVGTGVSFSTVVGQV